MSFQTFLCIQTCLRNCSDDDMIRLKGEGSSVQEAFGDLIKKLTKYESQITHEADNQIIVYERKSGKRYRVLFFGDNEHYVIRLREHNIRMNN